MRLLILYGTTEGQTGKIARFLQDRLRADGTDVVAMNAIDAPEDLDPTAFDAVIVAASLHTGHYQAAVEHFVRQHHQQLNDMLSVFVSVSLSAAGQDEDDVQGLAQCVGELQRTTGWTPRRLHHAAGAFRYTQYDFFKRWAMKYIAWRKGGPTDTSQDYELTDWDALSSFADELVAKARADSGPGRFASRSS
jgi:menaquinone-dependent protoporphyrinogen oxidase